MNLPWEIDLSVLSVALVSRIEVAFPFVHKFYVGLAASGRDFKVVYDYIRFFAVDPAVDDEFDGGNAMNTSLRHMSFYVSRDKEIKITYFLENWRHFLS